MSSTIETALILALDERHGPVSKIMPAGLLTAIHAGGRRTDLLIVPPDTGEQAAQAAMEQAAQAGNRTRTPALLAAPSVPVAKLLRLTGLDRALTIYPDLRGLSRSPYPDLRGALAAEQHEPAISA